MSQGGYREDCDLNVLANMLSISPSFDSLVPLGDDVVLFFEHFAAQIQSHVKLQVRLKGWQIQEAGDLETQLLAGHDGFADLDPLAPKDVHAGVVQLRHTDAAEGVALGALDISWSRARYYLMLSCAMHAVIDAKLAAA